MTLADIVDMDMGPVIPLRWPVPWHINYLKQNLANAHDKFRSLGLEHYREVILHLTYEIIDREQRPEYYQRRLEEFLAEEAIYAKEISRIQRGRRLEGAFVL